MEFPFGIIDTLLPLADPSGQTSDGKHDREHVERNSHGPQKDAAVKIHIGIQVVINKVGIF